MIKRDLGVDALILNTKKVKIGGFLGLFKKEKLEVIAAVESKPSEKKTTEPVIQEVQAQEIEIEATPELEQTSEPAAKEEEAMTSELISELKSIKNFMLQSIEEDRLPDVLKAFNKQLIDQGIDAELQSELLAKLMLVLDQHPNYSEEKILAIARKEIISLIKTYQKRPSRKKVDIICFIGPTGVGKTTTIAKIAAD